MIPTEQSYDHFWAKGPLIKKEWSFLPRRCYKTKKLLWFKPAYRASAIYTGPGSPVLEERWFDEKEFILMSLRGEY